MARKSKTELKEPGLRDLEAPPIPDDATPVVLMDEEELVELSPAESESSKKEQPETSKKEQSSKPIIALRAFKPISGIKPDHWKAFHRHARGMEPTTVEEWRKRYQAFLAKPVR